MNLQKAKINVMQKIMNVSKASLLDKINDILDEEIIVGYTTDGQPLTKITQAGADMLSVPQHY